MSAILAGKVWHSALDASLKPLAAALADIGDHDGENIYPSVAYVAWLLGKSERAVQYQLGELKKQSILEIISGEEGGRGRTVNYRLNPEKLPARQTWKEEWKARERVKQATPFGTTKRVKLAAPFVATKGEAPCTLFENKGEPGCTLSEDKGCNFEPERVKPVAPEPLVEPTAQNTRSVLSSERQQEMASRMRMFSDRAMQIFVEKNEQHQKPTWGPKHFVQLARLLRDSPSLTIDDFERRYRIMLASSNPFHRSGSLAYFCANYDLFIGGTHGAHFGSVKPSGAVPGNADKYKTVRGVTAQV